MEFLVEPRTGYARGCYGDCYQDCGGDEPCYNWCDFIACPGYECGGYSTRNI